MNDHYAELYSAYQWLIPSQFNIAQACVHRWAQNPHEGRRIALYVEDELGQNEVWSYSRLSQTANRLANGLVKMGVERGDRVALIMGQRPETVTAYTAVLSVGAIAVPLSGALKSDALAARLGDARIRVAIVDTASGPDLLQAQVSYPALTQIIGLGFQHENIIPWRTLLARQTDTFEAVSTSSNTPALLLYNEDPTNPPLGALLPHRALIGNLPGFVAAQNWFPEPQDVFWTPADWCQTYGLLNALLPTLYFGASIVATLGYPVLERAFEIMHDYKVTNLFLDSAMSKQVAQHQVPTNSHPPLGALRAIALRAEDANTQLFQWCEHVLGVTPNTVLGQTEINQIVASSVQKWGSSPHNAGRAVPGHRIAILDPDGKPCPAHTAGELAVSRYDSAGHPNPALFLGYWGNSQATLERYSGDWFLTGTFGTMDREGHVKLFNPHGQ